MSLLPSVFNSEEHEPMTNFTPIPEGWYKLEIVKSEVVATKAGTGKRLNMQAKVVDDEKYEGRIIFIGLNIQNPSKMAVEISMRELRSLCDAVELPSVEDSVDLHDIPFMGKAVIEKSEGYADKNVIKKYAKLEGFKEL